MSGSRRNGTPVWGQLVAGPPGSGKTTYCRAVHEFLNAAGRPTIIVNLDPANDVLPYTPEINIFDLVSLEDVAEAYNLGPNGGMMYCLEYLHANLDWLEDRLAPFRDAGYYFLFDCPGQAELYTHHEAFWRIVQRLGKQDYNLVAVHLVDASHCGDPAKFIAAALLSLTAMIRLELPHVNVLSKVDLLAQQGGGSDDGGGGGFDLDFFTDLTDISHLAYQLRAASGLLPQGEGASDSADAAAPLPPATAGSSSGPEDGAAAASAADAQRLAVGRKRRATLRSRYARLHDKLAEIVDDHSLVGFVPLSLAEPARLLMLMKAIDRAGGYVPLKLSGAAAQQAAQAAARIKAGLAGSSSSGTSSSSSSAPAPVAARGHDDNLATQLAAHGASRFAQQLSRGPGRR